MMVNTQKFISPLAMKSTQTKVCMVIIGTALMALSAKIQIPFWPVPATLQTMLVFMIGAAYGSRLGAATIALYLLEGAFGLPVFAGPTAGPTYFLLPSAGFLLGMVPAAYISGRMVEAGYGKTITSAAMIALVGDSVNYVPGMIWLAKCIGTQAMLANTVLLLPAKIAKMALGASFIYAYFKHVTTSDTK